MRGLRCLRAGDLDQAEALFSRAHRLAPERPEVCLALGRERLRQGRVDEAEGLLASAWAGDSSLVSAAATLARCRGVHQRRFAEAHAVLDDAAARHRSEPTLAVIRGELLLEEHRVAEARTVIEDVLRRCAEARASARVAAVRDAARYAMARVLNQEGMAHGGAGELDRALFAFKRAADLDPAWASPQVNLGAAFATLGRRQRARVAYQRALELDPDSVAAHYNQALLERDAGEAKLARAGLERALALDPEYPGLRPALAAACLATGDAARAVELCAAELEREPCSAAGWINLAAATAAAGDLARAESCLRLALDQDPGHPGACARLAELLARTGRHDEAAAMAGRGRPTS